MTATAWRPIPARDDRREGAAGPDRRTGGIGAAAAGARADPDLACGRRRPARHLERDGLEPAQAERQQALVVPPGRPGDVHAVGVDAARRARGGVDEQQIARHDHAIAAHGLDHRHLARRRASRRPSRAGRRCRAACERVRSGRIDERQMGAVPGALARLRGDDRDDRGVAAPARLPDVQLERRGDLSARRSRRRARRARAAARPRPRWNRRGASSRAARPWRRACPSRARRSARRRGRPRAAGCASRRATTRGAPRCRAPRRAGAPRRGCPRRARTAARCPPTRRSERKLSVRAVGRPAGARVAVRAVRDLPHPGAVRGGQADAAARAAPRASRAASRRSRSACRRDSRADRPPA